MKKEMRIHKLNRREALIGLTGIAAATPLLAGQGSVKPPKSAAKELAARPMAVNERDNPFDQDWLFHRGDISGAENPAFDDSRWRKLDLPHDWSIEDLTPVEEAPGRGRSGWRQTSDGDWSLQRRDKRRRRSDRMGCGRHGLVQQAISPSFLRRKI